MRYYLVGEVEYLFLLLPKKGNHETISWLPFALVGFLDDGLVQLFKERFKRIFSNTLADRIVGDSNGAFKISHGIVGENRATRFILDANLTGCID